MDCPGKGPLGEFFCQSIVTGHRQLTPVDCILPGCSCSGINVFVLWNRILLGRIGVWPVELGSFLPGGLTDVSDDGLEDVPISTFKLQCRHDGHTTTLVTTLGNCVCRSGLTRSVVAVISADGDFLCSPLVPAAVLEDHNVVLGVTGSIAAVKTVELAHELRRRGATVRAVMTDAATGIIHPWALSYATDHPAVTEITGAIEHVEYCGRDGWADAFVIAPTTANTVGKLAAAIDDTPVTTVGTTALGANCPVVLAPAMHEPMYDHPGITQALDRLREWGVSIVPARRSEGKAKLATIDAIVTETARAVGERPLADQHLIITAGATVEAIDPVRVLTNRASGRMGRALAKAAYAAGASVTIVHGPVGPHPPAETAFNPRDDAQTLPYAEVVSVTDTASFIDAVLDRHERADALLSAAAIADYTTETAATKLSSGPVRDLSLTPTPKLLDRVRESAPALPIVAFKTAADSETHPAGDEQLLTAARELQSRVDAAFVVANAPAVMGAATTTAAIVDDDETVSVDGSKQTVAGIVVQELATRLRG